MYSDEDIDSAVAAGVLTGEAGRRMALPAIRLLPHCSAGSRHYAASPQVRA